MPARKVPPEEAALAAIDPAGQACLDRLPDTFQAWQRGEEKPIAA